MQCYENQISFIYLFNSSKNVSNNLFLNISYYKYSYYSYYINDLYLQFLENYYLCCKNIASVTDSSG